MHFSGKLREFSAEHEALVCLIEIAEQMFIMAWLVTAATRECPTMFINAVDCIWFEFMLTFKHEYIQKLLATAASLFINSQIYHELFLKRSKPTNDSYICYSDFWLFSCLVNFIFQFW